jgi:hypothetical protein
MIPRINNEMFWPSQVDNLRGIQSKNAQPENLSTQLSQHSASKAMPIEHSVLGINEVSEMACLALNDNQDHAYQFITVSYVMTPDGEKHTMTITRDALGAQQVEVEPVLTYSSFYRQVNKTWDEYIESRNPLEEVAAANDIDRSYQPINTQINTSESNTLA